MISNYILSIEIRIFNWIVPLDKRKMDYEWFFSKESNEIYHREPQNIELYFATCIDNNNYEVNKDSKEKYECISNDVISITHINNQTSKSLLSSHSNFSPRGNQTISPIISKPYSNGRNY